MFSCPVAVPPVAGLLFAAIVRCSRSRLRRRFRFICSLVGECATGKFTSWLVRKPSRSLSPELVDGLHRMHGTVLHGNHSRPLSPYSSTSAPQLRGCRERAD